MNEKEPLLPFEGASSEYSDADAEEAVSRKEAEDRDREDARPENNVNVHRSDDTVTASDVRRRIDRLKQKERYGGSQREFNVDKDRNKDL